MRDHPLHHRKSIRLRGYDYSQAGLYFITSCAHERLPLFGEVIDAKMRLNDAGQIAYDEWGKTAKMRDAIQLHAFVVMPNHTHGIVEIKHRDALQASGALGVDDGRLDDGRVRRASTVGDVLRGYKSAVTKRINQLHNITTGNRIWQRNYHEHIIRNEEAYLKIADYIQTNPQRWEDDVYYV